MRHFPSDKDEGVLSIYLLFLVGGIFLRTQASTVFTNSAPPPLLLLLGPTAKQYMNTLSVPGLYAWIPSGEAMRVPWSNNSGNNHGLSQQDPAGDCP